MPKQRGQQCAYAIYQMREARMMTLKAQRIPLSISSNARLEEHYKEEEGKGVVRDVEGAAQRL